VPLDLDSPYQISKVVGEFHSVYYHQRHGLPTVRARFQNVYGPRELLGAGVWRGTPATIWRNVLPSFVYRALKGLPLRLDNGGDASRDFIYVEDIARGLVACALAGAPGDVYNLASGEETTILELATAINALAGGRSELEVAPRREWDRSGKRFGSPAKSERELGFRAEVPLADGLRTTVEWTRANLDRIDACIARHASHLEGEHAVAR
jgi:nucleoside-diphosphate-sugar epimerase